MGRLVFRDGAVTPNPKIVGRAATVMAEMAGIKVPAATRVLIAKLEGVGREVPLSAEKLSPILAFYSAAKSCRRDRSLQAAAAIRRTGPHVLDSFAE